MEFTESGRTWQVGDRTETQRQAHFAGAIEISKFKTMLGFKRKDLKKSMVFDIATFLIEQGTFPNRACANVFLHKMLNYCKLREIPLEGEMHSNGKSSSDILNLMNLIALQRPDNKDGGISE